MEEINLTCIRCPLGCDLVATVNEGEIIKITGAGCPRGIAYAEKEVLNPTRTLTTIVPISNGIIKMLPVKTSSDIPKTLINDCLQVIKSISVTAPVNVGDVILENICNSGADLVATRTIKEKLQ